jgi:CubicO group peptidase (beta-lactamase class C family)
MQRIFLAVASLTVGLPGCSADPPADAKAVDDIVRQALLAWRAPGVAVAIVREDKIVYLKGHGVKQSGKNDPVTPATLFPIASCTKAFTTTALGMLVDEEKMDWDDPVREHLRWFKLADPLADTRVTLRDLVTHRTGLGSHDLLWYRSPWDRDEIIRRIGSAPFKHSFRSTFQYQSTMFAAAGAALESAAGKKWEDFIQKRVFDPLGMASSCCTTTAAEKFADRSSPHQMIDNQPRVIPEYQLSYPDPAGSIYSNARDLGRWVRFHLGDGTFEGKRLLSAKTLQETHSPQMVIRLDGVARDMNPDTRQMNYGLGWVLQDYRGHFLVSHAGAIDGFRAHITLVPDAKLGIALLNNLHRTHMNLALSNQLVDHLLGLPEKDWNAYVARQVDQAEEAARAQLRDREARRRPGTRPSLDLAAYVGAYEDPAYGTAEIALLDGTLVWKWSTFTSELDHYQNDTFVVRNELIGSPRLRFTIGQDGQVATMRFLEVLEVEFQKAKVTGKSDR